MFSGSIIDYIMYILKIFFKFSLKPFAVNSIKPGSLLSLAVSMVLDLTYKTNYFNALPIP